MTTTLDQSLNDLRREIPDLRKDNYDMNRLGLIITVSKDSLRETEKSQQVILNQLQAFETSLAEINQILRTNIQQKIQLEQQQQQQTGKSISRVSIASIDDDLSKVMMWIFERN